MAKMSPWGRWQKRALLALALLPLIPLLAAQHPLAEAQGTAQGTDVVLLIDDSGSMKRNDPEGLRWSAAQLVVDLAEPGDRVAAVAFSTEVHPLGQAAVKKMNLITTQASREELKALLSPHPGEGWTNMRDALRFGLELIERERSGNRMAILFLTDGKPELPNNEDQRPELLALIEEASARGVPIFPVLLGTQVDRALAERMARRTGGLVQGVTDAQGLLEAYSQLYAFLQPQRYIDTIEPKRQVATFYTTAEQAVLTLDLIVPVQQGTRLQELTLDGIAVREPALPNGARVIHTAGAHYERVRISHSTPLTGEWIASLTGVPHSLLLLAEVATQVELLYPLPVTEASLVAVRRYPVGKPVFLLAAALRDGQRVGGVQLAAALDNELVPLSAEGLDPNGTLYGRQIDLRAPRAGTQTRIEIQVGQEEKPLRLRKTFVLEAADVPPWVTESPHGGQAIFEPDGSLLLSGRFDGMQPAQPEVKAIVYDKTSGSIVNVTLECVEGHCQGKLVDPIPAHCYEVLFMAQGTQAGELFTDMERQEVCLAARLIVSPASFDLGTVSPLQATVPVTLTAIGYADEPWHLEVADVRLVPPFSAVSPEVVLGEVLASTAGQSLVPLRLHGLDGLPPGAYSLEIWLRSKEEIPVWPEKVVLSFVVPQPSLTLINVGPEINWGTSLSLRKPMPFTLVIRSTHLLTVPEIQAVIAELHPVERSDLNVHGCAVSHGLAQRTIADIYRLELLLSCQANPPVGSYRGVLRFSSESGVPIYPSDVPFVVERLSLPRWLWLESQPARAFLDRWLWPRWPPRFLLGWIALFVLLNILRSLRPQPFGHVICDATGQRLPLTSNRPVAVLYRDGRVFISHARSDLSGVVAIVEVEEAVPTPERPAGRIPSRRAGSRRPSRPQLSSGAPCARLRPGVDPWPEGLSVKYWHRGMWLTLRAPQPLSAVQRIAVVVPGKPLAVIRYIGRS